MQKIFKYLSYVMYVIILLFLFVFSRFTISGHSMDPNFQDGQHLIVVKAWPIVPIKHNSVVIAKNPEDNSYILKRVIGLPGDKIEYKNDILYINDKKTQEPYISYYKRLYYEKKLAKIAYSYNPKYKDYVEASEGFTDLNFNKNNNNFKITVPKGQYFILGDNRIISNDSRRFGTIPRSNIKDLVVFN